MDAPLLEAGGFLFARHGQSEANAAGLIAGWLESPLSALGRLQAIRASRSMDAYPPDRIWSSTSGRAMETARVIGERFCLAPSFIEGLRERSWGILEGKPLGERTQVARGATPSGGESWDGFAARTMAAFRTLVGTSRTLVVAHSGTFRVLREALLGADPEGEPVPNCHIVIFSRVKDMWSMVSDKRLSL